MLHYSQHSLGKTNAFIFVKKIKMSKNWVSDFTQVSDSVWDDKIKKEFEKVALDNIINVERLPQVNNMQIDFNSRARDLAVFPNRDHFKFSLQTPIHGVNSVQSSDVFIPRSSIIPLDKTFTWKEQATPTVTKSVTIPRDAATSVTSLVTLITTHMNATSSANYTYTCSIDTTTGVFKCVQSGAGDAANPNFILFPDAPVISSSTSEAVANFARNSLLPTLGFLPGGALQSYGTTQSSNDPVNSNGDPYVLIEMKVNNRPVGNILEVHAGGVLDGPYFSRVPHSASDLNFTIDRSTSGGLFVFERPIDISSIEVALYRPADGGDDSVITGHSANHRSSLQQFIPNYDWAFSLLLSRISGGKMT